MKHSIIFLILSFISIGIFAQKPLTKKEKKAIKKELKAYKKAPEQYVDQKQKKDKKIEALEKELALLKEQLSKEWKKSDSLTLALAEAENTIKSLENSNNDCGKVPSQGIVYGVQIGNYKLLDLREFFNKSKGLRTETYTDGNAYVIGNFENLDAAKKFVEDMRKLGIPDAFITQYIDGNRIVDFDAYGQ